MNLTIGKMKKRINSTKFMYEATTTLEGVTLKEPTSIGMPVFLLHNVVSKDKNLDACNYCNTMGRFYWIDDIVHVTNDLVEIHCHTDVLATGQKYLRKKVYLSYCSDEDTAKQDWKLYDERFGPDMPVANKEILLADIEGTIANKLLVEKFGDGTFIVRCLIDNGGLIAWALDLDQFIEFYKSFIQSAPSTLDDFTCKYFGNSWKDCFASVLFVPIKTSELEALWTNHDPMTVGRIQISSSDAHYSSAPVAWAASNVNISIAPPIVASDVDFIHGDKYTAITFEYPGGSIDISSNEFIDMSAINVQETMNLIDGEYTANVYSAELREVSQGVYKWDKGELLAMIHTQLGYDITGMVQAGHNDHDMMVDFGIKAFNNLPSLAAGAFNVGASTVGYTLGDMKGILAEKGKTNQGNIAKSMISGVQGVFCGAAAPVSARSFSVGGGLTSYFRIDGFDLNHDPIWSKDAFRICVSTSVPNIMKDGSADYDEFCKENGYTCNKWIYLPYLPDGTYVRAVGASLGDLTPDTYLYPSEISELNQWLNTGIYLEDWTQVDPPEPEE